MVNERDTHFAGFAKLLYDEMEELSRVRPMLPKREMEQLLAQRAYDLVFYLFKTSDTSTFAGISGYYGGVPDEVVHERLSWLPDLTAWPNTSPEAP